MFLFGLVMKRQRKSGEIIALVKSKLQATSDCIFPVEDIKDFCFDNESSKLIQDFMVINKAAVFFSVSDHFQVLYLLYLFPGNVGMCKSSKF